MCLKTRFHFIKMRYQIEPRDRIYVKGYGVLSFPKNIGKGLSIAVNLLFEHNLGLNITKDEFKKLFEFATSGTYFLFQGILRPNKWCCYGFSPWYCSD